MIRGCPEIMDACDVDPFCSQPETRVKARPDFFIWIRCNPLKSPDSAKEKQGMQALGGLIPRARHKVDGNIAAEASPK
jgi:hypothetical protein